MANAREIQSRMKSIKDTMKITNAMYMISSSKLSKARTDLKNTEPYFFTMQDALAKILMESPDAGNRFFDQRPDLAPEDRKKGYIVVTADKGMAGAYNHNVIKIAEEATHTGENENHNKLFVVGEVGRRYFETKNIPVAIDFKYTAQNPNMNRARYIAEQVTELFVSGELDGVYHLYQDDQLPECAGRVPPTAAFGAGTDLCAPGSEILRSGGVFAVAGRSV